MIKFTSTQYELLKEELNSIALLSENMLQRAERSYQCAQGFIQTIKEYILDYQFVDEAEEIEFFKKIKPNFQKEIIYYNEIFHFEANRPEGNKEIQFCYYNRGIERIRLFFERNQEFHNYYRLNKEYKDPQYFLRSGIADSHSPEGVVEIDTRFCTAYSYKLSKIHAFVLLKDYLLKGLDELENECRSLPAESMSKSQLTWTDSKVALIELLYAIQSRGSVNNGKIEVKQLAIALGQVLNVDLGNYYAVFQQNIRIRKKSRTVYLDQLKEYLERRMDDSDENPRY